VAIGAAAGLVVESVVRVPSLSAPQRRLRVGRPLWLPDTARVQQRYPVLSGHHDTGVAVVGGGMTGALVAHAFASAGIATTVLEGAVVGSGSTAASSALLLKEPDLELTQLTARYGAGASRRIWELSHQSVDQLVALLKRLRIRCDLKTRDAVYYATTAEAADRLRHESALRARLGFDAEWLGPAQIRRRTGIAAHGAILSKGAQFDPYRACVGILRRASAADAQVFERSEVRRIEQAHDGVRIRTRQGMLRAERVVIATGYATPQFRPLAGRFQMYRTYVLATEPVDRVQRDDVGLSDVMVWDTERPYHYARWTPEHRLLLGGEDRLVRPGQRRRQQSMTAARDLLAYFEARLPGLATVRTERAWEGLFAMTSDGLPYIGPHRRYPHHWFALGYGGNGMTFGFLAARLLLERWQGVDSQDHALIDCVRADDRPFRSLHRGKRRTPRMLTAID
jgi:glycine/D-amino acid oxidase-like deaminating enzyme